MRQALLFAAATALVFGCGKEPSTEVASGGSTFGMPTDTAGAGAAAGGVAGAGMVEVPRSRQLDEVSLRARARYRTVGELFDRFVAPSCTGGAGACHHGWAAPDLTSFESFMMTLGAPCQVDAAHPKLIGDSCETAGDSLRFRNRVEREIVRVLVEPTAPVPPRLVTVELSGPAGPVEDLARVRYPRDAGSEPFEEDLAYLSAKPTDDEARLELDLASAPADLASAWDPRRLPKRGLDVRVADANGNGTRGSARPLRQMFPGRPEQSMMLLRLIGEAEGSRMPLGDEAADDASVRAMYCFIQTTALGAPEPSVVIDYEACDPKSIGEAPISAFGEALALFELRCNSGACHGADAAGGLDLRESSIRGGGLVGKLSKAGDRTLVTPRDPEASFLLCKVASDCQLPTGSARMPLAGSTLSSSEVRVVARWIEEGAELK